MAHSKFFLTSALTLFLCCMPCTLFAEDISQQELTGEESAGEKDISHAVSAGLYAFTGVHGFEPYSQAVAAVYQFNMPVLTANAAARFAYGDIQFSANTVWWAFTNKAETFHIGPGLTYNFNAYIPYSIANNILPGVFLQWQTCSFHRLSVDFSYFLKLRTIFAIQNETPVLVNNSVAFRFRNDFNLPANFSAFFEISSYEFFRYMIMCAPSFTVGASYYTGKHYVFTLEATAHAIDYFTDSAYYDSREIRIWTRYIF